MLQSRRFGRRIAIPSTRQIIHEMRMLEAEEKRQKALPVPPPSAAEKADAIVQSLR